MVLLFLRSEMRHWHIIWSKWSIFQQLWLLPSGKHCLLKILNVVIHYWLQQRLVTLSTPPPPTSLNSQVYNLPNWGHPIPFHIMDRGHPSLSLISPSSPPYGFAIFFPKLLDLVAKFCYQLKQKNSLLDLWLTNCPIITSISCWYCRAF